MKDILNAIRNFQTQNSHRPEASTDLDERLVQCLSELGRMAYSIHWNDPKEKIQERMTQLLIVLLGTCVQQEWDIEKMMKDRLQKLPTLPAPQKGREKVRGLRL
jgi:hypothetical protein